MNEAMSIYRVEISGWDLNEQFFVERSALQWVEGETRRALLRRKVRPGALLFVRLLQDGSPERTFPVAYRARQLRECEGGDSYELTLSQVWPMEEKGSRAGAEKPAAADHSSRTN